MCGIFGFAGSPDRQLLGRMAAAIVHRGPDDEGSFETPVRQPRSPSPQHHRPRRRSPAGRQRGRDRLAHLQRRGLQLPRAARRARGRSATRSARTATPRSSSTPTRSGATDCFARFNGMWAFAIADLRARGGRARRKLVLARDHFGIKPLYYARSPATGRAAVRAARSRRCSQDPELVDRAGRADGLRVPAARLPRPPRRDVLHGRIHVPAATWIELPLGDAAAAPGAARPPRSRAPPTGRRG